VVCNPDLRTRYGRVSACLPFPVSRGSACPNVMIASGSMAVPPVAAGAGAVRRCLRQPAVLSMTAPAGHHGQGGSGTDRRAQAASAAGAGAPAAKRRWCADGQPASSSAIGASTHGARKPHHAGHRHVTSQSPKGGQVTDQAARREAIGMAAGRPRDGRDRIRAVRLGQPQPRNSRVVLTASNIRHLTDVSA